MTAPVVEAVDPAVVDVAVAEGTGELQVRFPVMAIEDFDTADGRYLSPGEIISRALPMSILAQPFAEHGGQEPPPAVVVGRLDRVERVPGPEVISRRTGEPFPEGSFVWVGYGAVDPTIDVHGLNIGNLLRRRFLNGASVDLAGMDYEIVGEGDLAVDPEHPRRELITHSAEIAAVTLVPIPAFSDAYVELVGDDEPLVPVAPEELPDGFCASAFPAWRSAEVGDYLQVPGYEPDAVTAAADDGPHTGGMIALIPAAPEQLAVDGGDPVDQLHLTLAYLGEDVTGWDETQRAEVLDAVRQLAEVTPPIEAEVMGHGLFNPGDANDREPCAVYLVSGEMLPALKSEAAAFDVSEHPVFLPHITAGYGLGPEALSYVGPVTFNAIRVALGEDVTDVPLGGPAVEEVADAEAADSLAAEAAEEIGVPDAPQPCEFGPEPAVMSLLFDDDAQYVPVCAEHEPDGRDLIEQNGATVAGVVEIEQSDVEDPDEEIV